MRIKDCPFCGSRPTFSKEYQDTGGGDGRAAFRIECSNSKCKVQPYAITYGPHGYRREDDPVDNETAIMNVHEFWNTRASCHC